MVPFAPVALDESLRKLLEDVMSRRTPGLRRAGFDLEGASDAELDEVSQALLDEFVEAGFGPGGEPTQRGLLLERLVEEVARPLMRRSRSRGAAARRR